MVLGPVNPALKVTRFNLVAVDESAFVLQIGCMQIQAMAAGDQAQSRLDILPQIVDRLCLARVISGGLNAAARQLGAGRFKAADVITLPAVHGNRNRFQLLQSRIDIHAPLRVALLGEFICANGGPLIHMPLSVPHARAAGARLELLRRRGRSVRFYVR